MASQLTFKLVLYVRLKFSKIWLINKINYFKYFALNRLDIEIEQVLNYRNGYFVEIGANNGVKQSNSLYFELFRGWHGLLIEPHPELFSQLRKNRSSKSICVNSACISFSFERDSIEMLYSDLMTTSLETFNILPNPKEHAINGSKFWNGVPSVFTAKSSTLQQILQDVGAPTRIDFLSLDVEGSELEVLSGINHEAYRFNLICVETSDINKMTSFMKLNNYELLKQVTNHDYFFKDNDFEIR